MITAISDKGSTSFQAAAGFRSPRRSAWAGRSLLCLACLFATAMTARAQGVGIFMGIGGTPGVMGTTQKAPLLRGSSTDPQYTNWVSVLSISHAMSLPATTGISQHTDVSVAKFMDTTTASLTLLVNGVATGLPVTQPIDQVTIDFRAADATVYYRMQLYNVTITSYSVISSGETPSEQVSLKYQRIRWSYLLPSTSKPVTTGWDLIKNAPY